jgi:dihydroorotate dehydrogenase (NAD+) catalytic subunit
MGKEGNLSPIICRDGTGYRNAVGLANPGAPKYAEEMEDLMRTHPEFEEAIIIASIFGSTAEEYVAAAKAVSSFATAIELNQSCPHAQGFGSDASCGMDENEYLISELKKAVDTPIIVKLSPNRRDEDIVRIAKECMDAGALGFTVVNTVTPAPTYLPGTDIPILFNREGGASGAPIFGRGKDVAKLLRAELGDEPFIVAGGGMSCTDDAREYLEFGDMLMLGSILIGNSSRRNAQLIESLVQDFEDDTHNSDSVISFPDMTYQPVTITEIEKLSDTLRIFHFDTALKNVDPCQFLFLAVPGESYSADENKDRILRTMEKPFSIPFADPLALAVRRYPQHQPHHFTSALWEKTVSDTLFVRGPYGVSTSLDTGRKTYLVGGGTGTAALTILARDHPEHEAFIGASTGDELLFEDAFGSQHTSTDDGSFDYHGNVAELLSRHRLDPEAQVVTCGPTPMMKAVVEYVRFQGIPDSRIHVVTEPRMDCGVGACDKCAYPDGTDPCVDGHILTADRFLEFLEGGWIKRDACGCPEMLRG